MKATNTMFQRDQRAISMFLLWQILSKVWCELFYTTTPTLSLYGASFNEFDHTCLLSIFTTYRLNGSVVVGKLESIDVVTFVRGLRSAIILTTQKTFSSLRLCSEQRLVLMKLIGDLRINDNTKFDKSYGNQRSVQLDASSPPNLMYLCYTFHIGMKMIERHRMVNKILATELSTQIHALSIQVIPVSHMHSNCMNKNFDRKRFQNMR